MPEIEIIFNCQIVNYLRLRDWSYIPKRFHPRNYQELEKITPILSRRSQFISNCIYNSIICSQSNELMHLHSYIICYHHWMPNYDIWGHWIMMQVKLRSQRSNCRNDAIFCPNNYQTVRNLKKNIYLLPNVNICKYI